MFGHSVSHGATTIAVVAIGDAHAVHVTHTAHAIHVPHAAHGCVDIVAIRASIFVIVAGGIKLGKWSLAHSFLENVGLRLRLYSRLCHLV